MMKRQEQNRNNRGPNRRNLRIESLEDRRLLTVAAELAPMPQQMQRGSDHLPAVAEIAVEKATDSGPVIHNNGAYRDLTNIGLQNNRFQRRVPAAHNGIIILEDHWPGSDLANIAVEKIAVEKIAVEKIAVEKIAVEKFFNRMGLQNHRSVMDPNDCPNVIDGLESAGIEADQSAGRMVDDGLMGCDTTWVADGCRGDSSVTDDAACDVADWDGGADAEDSSESTNDTSNSLMVDDDDEGIDDEAPGLPGEDGSLDPEGGNGGIDPAETAGSDGDKVWDLLQDGFFPPGW